MIRVFLVEDERLVRDGIKSLLSLASDIQVIGEAENGSLAVERIPLLQPEVVLLDLRMPVLDGLDVLERLGKAGTLPPTLVLTTFNDRDALLEAVRRGARGWLRKDVSLEDLLGAIRALAEGGTVLHPTLGQGLLNALSTAAADFPRATIPERLTAREREVVRLMAGGYSNKEIGEALGAAETTVKHHVSSVLGKLGVRDRTQAVLLALAQGLA